MPPIIRFRPLRRAGECNATDIAGKACNAADRGEDHSKDEYLNKMLGGVTMDCGFPQGDGLCVLCDGEGFLSGNQRLIAHQPTQRIQTGGGGNGGETQYVGVGHMMIVGHRQAQIAIRELRCQLRQQRLDLLYGNAASRLTQCRRINTGRREHRRGVHASARQVARYDSEITGEDSLFGH